MRKRIAVFGIALVMICGIHGNVTATTCVKESDVPFMAYHNEKLDIDPVQHTVKRQMQNGSLAESYMSPYVTSVKDQNPYGTCWAFAFVGASEASMVKEGLVEKSTVDMSELHLAYFLSHSVTDPLGGTAGDRFSLTDTSLNSFLSVGGNQETATYRVANWYGLVNESTAPYDSITEEEMVLDDSIAYGADVSHLENAYWISMRDQDTVKTLIMQYGACASSYCSKNPYYSTGNSGSANQQEAVAVYCPDNLETDHGITIVGWDDTYSRNNFGTYKPDKDGAWYCKNSWGSDWSKDGYFWLSYEDVPSSNGEAFFYDYGRADNYDNNYQYDGGAVSAKYDSSCGANIFTAQKDEYIRAVGFYTYDSNYDCTVKVYKNCKTGNPTSGTLLTTVNANQLYAGFHTVSLNDAYRIRKGESFSVVVEQSATDGEKTYIMADYNYAEAGEWCSNTSASLEGQSYVLNASGHWKDLCHSENKANCRIKAYTDIRVPVTKVSLNQSEMMLYKGDTDKLSATVTPANATNKKITWSSTDETVVSVDADGNVKAKGVGTAKLVCTSDDDEEIKAICNVTVKQWVQGVDINYVDYELMAGNRIQLNAKITPKDATDKSVVWTSGEEKVATVSDDGTVTAVGYGKTTITCTASDQNIYSDTCEITVYELINRITLNTLKANLKMGDTLQLTAATEPELSYTKGLYWTTSNADIVTVTQDGLLTVVSDVSGTVEIKCMAKDGTGVNATCVVQTNIDEKEDNQEETENAQDKEGNYEIIINTQSLQYKLTKDGNSGAFVELMSGADCSGKVEIPKTVTIDGVAYKVTSIGDNAFENNKQITQVIMGDNVTRIGKNAFSGCSNLTKVSIGKSVKTIDSKAFYNCKRLKMLKIGKNVKTIGKKAFYQCIKLTKVEIPSKVSVIGEQAFYKCKNLKTITFKTSRLTKNKVGKNAFKGIHGKATIKVPKKKVSAYRTLLKEKGIGKNVKVKKI